MRPVFLILFSQVFKL